MGRNTGTGVLVRRITKLKVKIALNICFYPNGYNNHFPYEASYTGNKRNSDGTEVTTAIATKRRIEPIQGTSTKNLRTIFIIHHPFLLDLNIFSFHSF